MARSHDPSPERPSSDESASAGGAAITAESECSSLLLSAVLLRLRTLWPWLAVGLAAWLGWEEVRKIDLLSVRGILHGAPAELVLAMLLFTGFNLALAGLYDVAALGPLDRPPRVENRWGVGVITFAWSNFLTLGPLAGPALRLWLYKPLGVAGRRAHSALSAILVSFSLGLLAWCAVSAVPLPAGLDSLAGRLALGVLALALTAASLTLLRRLRGMPRIFREWEGSAAALASIALADWLLAWLVFHWAVFGMRGGVPATLSLRAFFFGQLIGGSPA